MVGQIATRASLMADGLDMEALSDLKAAIKGDIILPGDRAYESARHLWNARVDKHPAMVVRPAEPMDVACAVAFARQQELPLSVRGGGHNPSGIAIANGGLVIDLRRMRNVSVDPIERTALAEGGATWGEVDRMTQVFGLATTGTDVSTVGIGGSTLGGGHGWLGRLIGLTIDSLESVEMVTAEGRLVRASDEENPDLFWAVRGAGANFGVVTSLKYRLHPIGPTILEGVAFYPMARAAEVLRFYRDFTSTTPEELTTVVLLMALPDGQRVIGLAVCYAGDLTTSESVLRPIKKFGSPLLDVIGPVPYVQHQSSVDEHAAPGNYSHWKAGLLDNLSDGFIEAVAERFATMPSPRSIGILWHLGGAISRVAPEATAYYHRAAQYHFRSISVWADPSEAEANVQWSLETYAALKDYYAGKVYVNHLDADDREKREREAYGGNYDRLVALKNRYDPTNLFSSNFNIRPTL